MTPTLRLALALALLPGLAAAQGIEVTDALAAAPRSGAAMAAAYMTVRNPGGAPDRLLGAESPVAERAEIHLTVEGEGGVMRMGAVEGGLDVPAGGELVLGQGGHHLMLIGLGADFDDAATIALVLAFEAAGQVALDVPVRIGVAGGHGEGRGG